MPHSELGIEKLRLMVHLGCEADERLAAQPVDVSVTVRFDAVPAGCETDELSDTVCYARLSEAIKALVKAREFNLIEHLAFALYGAVRAAVGSAHGVAVRVHKLHPPVADLEGGSTFWYGDWA